MFVCRSNNEPIWRLMSNKQRGRCFTMPLYSRAEESKVKLKMSANLCKQSNFRYKIDSSSVSIYRAQHKHKLSQIRSIIYSVKINIACRCWMWWDKDRMNEKSETKNNTIQIELEKWRNWTINLNFVLFKSLSCHTLHRRAIDRQQSKSTRLCRRQQ